MTSREAKEVLLLYRPGTADEQDPSFAEARALCARDPELQLWFDRHCAVYQAVRAKLQEAGIAPEGLKEQIIAERNVHEPVWHSRIVLVAAATAIVLMVFTFIWTRPPSHEGLPAFREDMVGTALRVYQMQVETNDLAAIRDFFTRSNSIADYVLPGPLEQTAQPAGCVAFTWHGKPVSMICFHTGGPRPRGFATDLWIFVTDQSIAPGAPASSAPEITKINQVTAASWSENGKTYVLAVIGDEATLRKYL